MKFWKIWLFVLMVLLLAACTLKETDGPVELWVVTEETDRFGMASPGCRRNV